MGNCEFACCPSGEDCEDPHKNAPNFRKSDCCYRCVHSITSPNYVYHPWCNKNNFIISESGENKDTHELVCDDFKKADRICEEINKGFL